MSLGQQVAAIAELGDGLRLRLFEFVRDSPHAVSREEAAAHAGISRKLAAFHLDKLVRAGLLRAHFGPPGGGARRVGRAPKLYAASETDIQVSIPRRDHLVIADILVAAVSDESRAESAEQAALRIALERGKELGLRERGGGPPRVTGPEEALSLAEGVLRRHGFEPYRKGPRVVRLRNCPFQPLAAKAPHLVCGMNHAYLAGLLSGMEIEHARAHLAPQDAECCVELRA